MKQKTFVVKVPVPSKTRKEVTHEVTVTATSENSFFNAYELHKHKFECNCESWKKECSHIKDVRKTILDYICMPKKFLRKRGIITD